MVIPNNTQTLKQVQCSGVMHCCSESAILEPSNLGIKLRSLNIKSIHSYTRLICYYIIMAQLNAIILSLVLRKKRFSCIKQIFYSSNNTSSMRLNEQNTVVFQC